MSETPQEAYERGAVAGGIEARLVAHDVHLDAINGSIDRNTEAQHEMALALQRLGDQAAAREAREVALALALKEANEARRAADDDKTAEANRKWSPLNRISAAAVAAGAVVGAVYALRGH